MGRGETLMSREDEEMKEKEGGYDRRFFRGHYLRTASRYFTLLFFWFWSNAALPRGVFPFLFFFST